MRMAQHNAQYLKLLPCRGYSTVYHAQNNSCAYEIMLANEILTLLCLYLRLWSVGSSERPKMQGTSVTDLNLNTLTPQTKTRESRPLLLSWIMALSAQGVQIGGIQVPAETHAELSATKFTHTFLKICAIFLTVLHFSFKFSCSIVYLKVTKWQLKNVCVFYLFLKAEVFKSTLPVTITSLIKLDFKRAKI